MAWRLFANTRKVKVIYMRAFLFDILKSNPKPISKLIKYIVTGIKKSLKAIQCGILLIPFRSEIQKCNNHKIPIVIKYATS
jgi:hypothetical protein